MLVCLPALLCTRDTPGSSRARRSPTVSGTLFSTVLLQQVAWEGGLRQVRGCDHAALPWAELPAALPVSRSVPWPDRYVDDLLRVGPPFWHKSPSDCPSSGRFTIRNQDVLTGLHPETDEYTKVHPVFCFRSICERTHSTPHSFSEHASAHVVSADLATVRMELSHQAQLCPGSARWWRAQSSKQWSSILVVSAFGS